MPFRQSLPRLLGASLLVGAVGAGAVAGTVAYGTVGARLPRRMTFALCFLLAGAPGEGGVVDGLLLPQLEEPNAEAVGQGHRVLDRLGQLDDVDGFVSEENGDAVTHLRQLQ